MRVRVFVLVLLTLGLGAGRGPETPRPAPCVTHISSVLAISRQSNIINSFTVLSQWATQNECKMEDGKTGATCRPDGQGSRQATSSLAEYVRVVNTGFSAGRRKESLILCFAIAVFNGNDRVRQPDM